MTRSEEEFNSLTNLLVKWVKVVSLFFLALVVVVVVDVELFDDDVLLLLLLLVVVAAAAATVIDGIDVGLAMLFEQTYLLGDILGYT